MNTNHKPTQQTQPEHKSVITKEFLEELMKSDDIAIFRKEHFDCFVDISFKEYIDSIIDVRELKRSDIIKASGLTETYAYQIFAGIKNNPSRDKLLALAIGMRLNLEECQKLLRLAGAGELYAKNRRDAVIIFGIKKGLGVPQMNDLLFELEEFTL